MQSLIDLGALQPTGDLSSDLFVIAQDQPFRFPSTFTFVIRVFSTIEGIGYTESRFLVCKHCCTLCTGTSRFKAEAANWAANHGADKESYIDL
ncbi:hypothetical protein AHAS_Ahas16G0198800 [Arachis hypogaea]